MTRISFAKYAAHRKVSRAAVSHALKNGRITAHTDEKGQRYLLLEEADLQWLKNTDTERGVPAQQKAKLEATTEQKKAAAQKKLTDRATAILNSRPTEAAAFDEDDDEPSEVGDDGEVIPHLFQSKKLKEAYLAKAAKLKYETDRGQVVPIEDIKESWNQIVAVARTKILGIPSKCRQRSPDMSNETYLILESIVRESLEDIADAGN